LLIIGVGTGVGSGVGVGTGVGSGVGITLGDGEGLAQAAAIRRSADTARMCRFWGARRRRAASGRVIGIGGAMIAPDA
jgi:hypothetical protein